MAKEIRGRATLRKQSASHWRMQNITQESVDSSDDEFFDAREVLEGKTAMLLGMSQWNSNDLVEQIETLGHIDQTQESLYRVRRLKCVPQTSIDGLEEAENKCQTHVLVLVVHGGNILDLAGGEAGAKTADVNTLSSVLEKVSQDHFQAAAQHVVIKLVPCPAVCAEAFCLVSNLNPYSYDESCVSSSVDHLPLAALPLLAIAAPHYQDAVATVIARANQVYHSFLQSPEGQGFTGQVCLMGDCVGGVLCFDALCFSNSPRHSSPIHTSRHNSTESLKDNPEVSPSLSSSKRLSRSNIDLSAPSETRNRKTPLSRKQSDSYDGDSSGSQHPPFLSSVFSPVDEIHSYPDVFLPGSTVPVGAPHSSSPQTEHSAGGRVGREVRRSSLTSMDSQFSGCWESRLSSTITNISSSWWGSKRLDYALYCPDVLTSFPTVALPHLFHASYWESTDVVAFLLRQVMHCDYVKAQEMDNSDSAPFSPSSPREKWLRRRTHVKLRNVTANHRVNDIIVTEDGRQTLVGRFMYGPLDMVTLTGEKVDVYVMTQPQSGRWKHLDTEMTNSSGRVTYTIPKSKKLAVGVYPIKMVVKGDQTSAEAFLTVLPRGMECVVFSIDGSFAASVSIMGSDPKVRPGAVDVVRHWQDLGYLIIYITGRPDMQKQRVVSWLSQHNFPQGMIFFSEGLVHDPLRQKTIFLRNLVQECHIKINCAYGSMKDISVYSMLGLNPNQIYIVGRPSKKYQNQCQFLSEGYAVHLSSLQFRARPKKSSSVRMVLRKGSFGLSAKPDFLCKRTHLRRTMSVQQPEPPMTPNPKPERAQSQPESDKDHGGGGGPGNAMWARGSMHRGDTTP
ncbi:membrane-associated phosphatidylinositol transfer protein 3-like [Sinocyclocheilus grahami]|uniref:membrane-associated phosphatidylinositol transfer protein 3-like n=1 Tax=Sinocyclocheilus grahami TaxID=75366 RepID=UPI0007AC7110|nr:PREDICTED: membrane-associated phosphatidylinositol transfer protein 3-like [Sinocyclocheilus grahami]